MIMIMTMTTTMIMIIIIKKLHIDPDMDKCYFITVQRLAGGTCANW